MKQIGDERKAHQGAKEREKKSPVVSEFGVNPAKNR
jgi:hypothetical protein